MYYFFLFFGVISVLTFVAWRTPAPWPAMVRDTGRTGRGTGRSVVAAETAGDLVSRLLQGERKEDKPCLTPVDCVQANRCAGNCGCH